MTKISFKEELRNLPLNKFNLKFIYAKYDVSHSYASELFKKECGKTFRQLRNEKIIEEAKKYLINTVLDIEQISRNFGYSNIKEFKRFFKKETGFAPDQFRKKYITDKTDKMPLD